jgi:hypothetical protein
MSIKQIKTLAAALLASLLLSSTAFAADTGNTTIVRIAPWGSNTQIQTAVANTCNTSKQLEIQSPASDHGARNFDIALAAMLSGRTVNINYSCSGSVAIVTAIRLL